MIELKNISLSFGARRIFDSACAVINRGDRIGLVGSNGAGKSTLMKILAGLEAPDGGEISKPKGATVGYLPQEGIVTAGRRLLDEAESSFADIMRLRALLAEADGILASADPSSDEYAQAVWRTSDLRQRLEDAEESKMRPRAQAVLGGLGFSQSDMARDCSEFSGGWQMRIAMAKLLLAEPSLLMLDEPTNHLDIESVAWLEDYLLSYRGAIMLVSHDRSLLNGVCTRIIHAGSGRLDSYAGNYDSFEIQSEARRRQIERAAANQSRQIEKTERFIERFRYKASKAAQVQSRIKMLDKIDRIKTEETEAKIKFSFPPAPRSGQTVLKLSGIEKSFGGIKVLKGVNLRLERGQRVGVAGVNGAGKSTLAKIIAGELAPDSGTVELGLNVKPAFFAQHQSGQLNPSNDALTEAEEAADPQRRSYARSLLGSFLFRGDDVFKKVSVLSGGEKNRLALVKILLKEFNFLLLDEPTNHLDMASKAVLQEALKNYDGTCMIVSHDRAFLDPLVDEVIELSPGGMRIIKGNLSDYVEKIRLEGRLAARPGSSARPGSEKDRRKKQAQIRANISRLRRETASFEAKIAQAETDLEKMELQMASPDFFKKGPQCAADAEAYNRLKEELEGLYSEWERAQSELIKAESGNENA
ncbi:MAG: ABC transporter ATP-binding protein [Verrucomicrobia bacterium]|nr:MAG: ABC transporter ATP-binding protein [Verrucomicrobiota bacterium]